MDAINIASEIVIRENLIAFFMNANKIKKGLLCKVMFIASYATMHL